MPHVAVPDTTPVAYYAVGGTPSLGPFTIPWVIFNPAEDLKVYVGGALATYNPAPSTSLEYSFSGSAIDGGYDAGSISLGATVSNTTIAIVRDVPIRRTSDFPYPANTLNIKALNTDLDRLTAVQQQLERRLARGIRQPDVDSVDLAELPAAAGRANMFVAFDAAGQPIASGGPSQQPISGPMLPVVQAAARAAAFNLLLADLSAADKTAARQAFGALGTERVAKAGAHTVVNGDKGKTIACANAPWTLTFDAPTSYDADFAVLALNESTTRAIRVAFASGGTDFWLYPGQTAFVQRQDAAWRVLRPERWRLAANTTIYVATTGSDANDGLAAGSPLLTPQTAIDRVAGEWDCNGYEPTIQLADGTYNTASHAARLRRIVGSARATLAGNTGTPANCVLAPATDAHGVLAEQCGYWRVQGVQITGSGNGYGVIATGDAFLELGTMRYSVPQWCMLPQRGATIFCTGNFEVAASCMGWINATTNGNIVCTGRTLTLTGTPAWSVAGVYVAAASNAIVDAMTFSGSATGKRYDTNHNSVIYTAGGGASYLPGSLTGTAGTGGQYV